jgi:hypothetical protein
MSDHQHRNPAAQAGERPFDLCFRCEVYICSRFIENKDARLREERTSKKDTLPFTD